jgi:hypothetical protein
VSVVAVRGTWAQVSLHDVVVGWVDGRKLLPPLGGSVVHPSSVAMPAPEHVRRSIIAVDLGGVIGLIGSTGIIVGSAMTWARVLFIGASSFDIPIQFLFNSETTSRHPRIGWVLLALGVLGIVASLVPRAGSARVLVGVAALAIAVLYLIQLGNVASRGFQPFSDIVGSGAWVTGGASLLLILSPLFHRRALAAV